MTTCAVCLGEVDEDESNAYSFDCTHRFHATCIVDWLRQGNLSCPTCRTDVSTNHLDTFTVRERAKYLRSTVARRKSAPAELKRLVDGVRRAEELERAARHECVAYHRAHADVFKTHMRLRTKRFAASRRVTRKTRLLGVYASADYPLPPLVVHNYRF